MRLNEAFEQVMEAVQATLEAKKDELEIATVIRGDRARPRPQTPAVWIFAENAQIDHTSTSIQEKWKLPIVLAAIVKDDNTEAGYTKASNLAALSRSALLKDRTLGLRSFVQDVRSSRFEPSGPWHNDGNLYCSVAVVDVIFLVRE